MKIFNLSHKDLDGVVSTYLIRKFFGRKNVDYKLTNYKDFEEDFNNISGNIDYLFVSDLNWTRGSLFIGRFKNKIIWLDHHKWNESIVNIVKEFGEIIIDEEKCGAEIVYEYLEKNKEKFGIEKSPFNKKDEELLKLTHDFDLGKFKIERSKKLSLALLLMDVEEYLKKVLERGKIWDNRVSAYYKWAKEKLKSIKEKVLDEGLETVLEGKRILIDMVYGKDIFFSTHLFNELKEEYDLLILYNENGKISLRGKIPVIEIAKYYGGGGHLNAAGGNLRFVYPYYYFDEYFKKRILEDIVECGFLKKHL